MKTYICNTFTNAMLDPKREHALQFSPISENEAKEHLTRNAGFESAVGHPALADILTKRTGIDIRAQRLNVRLESGEVLIVAQVVVPRLAEGQVLSADEIAVMPIQWWFIR